MKKQYLIGLLLLIITPLYSVALDHRQKAPAIEHLLEVNAQWIHFQIAAPDVSVSFNSDIERIQYHLNLVHSYLAKQQADLSAAQLSNRTDLLHELKEYAQTGIFPTNTGHTKRTPYFIDNYGVHCAVGYLIMRSGNSKLSNRISQEYNYSLLADIKTKGIIEWANEYGFTFNELEWIQPSYQPEQYYETVGSGTNGNIVHIETTPLGLLIIGDFDKLNGSYCNKVGLYKDDQFQSLNFEANGTIEAAHVVDDAIYVSGQFIKDNKNYVLAIYQFSTWSYFSHPTGNLAKDIFVSYDNETFVVIESNDGDEVWQILNGNWTFIARSNGVINTVYHNYSVSSLWVGGAFDSLFYSDEFITTDNNLVVRNWSNEWKTISGALPDTILTIKGIGGYQYIAGRKRTGNEEDRSKTVYLSRPNGNTIETVVNGNKIEGYSSSVNNVYMDDNRLLLVGEFVFSSGLDLGRSIGILNLVTGYMESVGYFNFAVNSVAYYEGSTYVAGDFTHSNNDRMNHIARMKQDLGSIAMTGGSKISSYPNPFTNSIHIDGLESGFDYSLRDIQGKVLQEGRSINNEINDLNELPSGMYILQLSDGIRSYELKVVK